ncbi:MAG: TolC family protein [Planctomycetota bacterium]
MAGELVEVSNNAVDVSSELFDAGESPRTAVLQAELELQKAVVIQQQAQNEQQAARTQLAALFGESELPVTHLDGDPFAIIELEGFEQSFDSLVNTSPEIGALFADIERARRQLDRACVEPVPDLTWQANLLYDMTFDEVVTAVQIGMPIPTLNQNQGAIHQARHEIVAAERAVESRALQLRQRLTTAYEQYIDARIQIDKYRTEVLPRAETTLELFSDGYRSGEVEFIQLLTAQRTYSELSMAYLDKLQELWQRYVAIQGMLLSGSLN